MPIKLYRCAGSGNTLRNLSYKPCVPTDKTEDLNLSVLNMIAGLNELETLTKHISCECKCKFYGRNCKSNQWQNNDKCRCKCEKHHICGKNYVWNSATCNCESGKHLASIMNDSAIIYDEVIEPHDEEISFNEKKAICKTQNFYILHVFLLITIALLTAVNIYCYLINYQGKQ